MKIKLPQTSLKLGSTQVLRHSALTKTNIKETRLSSIQTHINLITHKTPIQPKEIKFIGKINKKKINHTGLQIKWGIKGDQEFTIQPWEIPQNLTLPMNTLNLNDSNFLEYKQGSF